MANWFSEQCIVSEMHKALKNIKVAILCIVLLLVVICSMFVETDLSVFKFPDTGGCLVDNSQVPVSGEFKNSTSDTGNSTESTIDIYSYEAVELDKIYLDEPEEVKASSEPYILGPKISDWDEKRAKWLKSNPHFPSFVQPGKPRVLLVTGSSPKGCENQVGDLLLLKSMKNKIDYCRIHGLEIFYNTALLDDELTGFWVKLPLIRKLLLSHPEVEFIWWMDSDAMFTDMSFELPWERYKDTNMVLHGWKEMVYDDKNWIGLNTGSFLLRNTQWGLDLLDAWAPMGPKGTVRDEAGKVLSKELKGRPVFEADDQSAMVYLLATQREKWGNKVYLENEYYLHGYWGIIVDKFEEMIENYHPGLGDQRWPLVTHFVGCKPCSKSAEYPAERCLREMERAYNFADNQVLEMYGFRHKSLGSTRAVKIRNETSNPLEAKDVPGLLHPPFKAMKISP